MTIRALSLCVATRRSTAAAWVIALGFVGACNANQLTVRAISNATGVPMPGVSVQVADQGWETTDANGEAKFTAVDGAFTVRTYQSFTQPTALAVDGPQGTVTIDDVRVFEGQTGSDVVVSVDGTTWSLLYPRAGWNKVGVSGAVTGRTQGAPASAWVQASNAGYWLGAPVAADGTFDLGALFQSPQASVTVRAAEGEQEYLGGTLTKLYAVGSATVPVTSGGHATGVAITMQPVTWSTAEGTVSLSDWQTYAATSWSLRFGPFERAFVGGIALITTAFSVSVPAPSLAGAETWVSVDAHSAGAFVGHDRRVSLPATGLVFSPPPRIDLVSPADGAGFDDTTVFQWSSVESGGVYSLSVDCSWGLGTAVNAVLYTIATTATQATIPAGAGVSVPVGSSCDWSVSWRAATDETVEVRWSQSPDRNLIR